MSDFGEDEIIDYESLPSSSPVSHQLMAGAFAGIMEHSIMFPIDAIKTRMQSETLGAKVNNSKAIMQRSSLLKSSIIKTIASIATTEGSMSLWRGVQSVILGAGPAHAVYFATYEIVKEKLTNKYIYNNNNNNKDQQYMAPLITGFSGMCATVAADALMNPFDTIKQRMQLVAASKEQSSPLESNEKSSKLNAQVKPKNDRMLSVASKIYKNEGFLAFYYSYPTTIAMNIPFAALNFIIYESTTKYFNPSNTYNPWIHCLCGGISGATCAAITTPLDCIKTVLQVRGSEQVTQPVFKEAATLKKAASAIYKVFGWKGFWRGLKPRVISNIPATALSWTAYECAKHFLYNNSITNNI
ncbi:uncharacterized protein SCDLUD_002627 [Saccharomycodes ludwigii]|uniref:uncharacterized protein n=1 Tax=Saccharomycodes ludwigii TaxID=36035 RepID=UPI001E892177|nr:hypothetical protein SCDLUD_002627 [Saccharomycodes ludwigii]KAH3901144.1 hypothetical protein SCDLUD_002627 [Saccharomycodes ludwigii]